MINYSPIYKLLNGHATKLGSEGVSQIQKLEMVLKSSNIPQDLMEKAADGLERVKLSIKYGGNFSQLEIISRYFDWITKIPWIEESEDTLEIASAKQIMEKNHYGLTDVKKRILEYLAVLSMQKKNLAGKIFHAPVLLFVGLAGTGKTSFAHSVAEALGRKFVRIPFGGLSSALDLRGMTKVQPEAEPGLIIKALTRVGVRNPVILLDELDRVTPESNASVMGVLLELLDPAQNSAFIDHYIDFPFDLSHAIFIATANNTKNISTAVMDRLEVIQMPSYRDDEKIEIGKNYILPKLIKETGLPESAVQIDDPVWEKIARVSGFDPGIRSVQRKIESIVRKVTYKIVTGQGQSFKVDLSNADEYFAD